MTAPSPPREFVCADEGIRWTGSLDPSVPEAPRVSLLFGRQSAGFAALERAVEQGDPAAASEAVRAIAMPLGMLDDLAAHCVRCHSEASRARATGEGDPDPRWARALARRLGACEPAPSRSAGSAAVVHTPPDGLRLRALRALDGGGLVALCTDLAHGHLVTKAALAFRPEGEDKWRVRRFEVAGRGGFDLPRPAQAPSDRVWLVARTERPARATLHVFDIEGTPIGAHEVSAPSPVQHVSLVEGHLWLHADRHLVRVGREGEPHQVYEHEATWPGPTLLGTWAALWSPAEYDRALGGRVARTLQWVDLATGTALPPRPWNRSVGARFAVGDALLVSTEREVFAVGPSRDDRQVRDKPAYGFARDGDTVWLGTTDSLAGLDAARLLPTAEIPLKERVVRCLAAPGGIAVWDAASLTVVHRDGRVLFESGPRREPAACVLANGTLLVSAGERVAAIGPDGVLRGTTYLPFDGQLVGATASVGIFGPVSGGIPKTPPTGLFAIDERGAIVDALPAEAGLPPTRPMRIRYADGAEADQGAVLAREVLLVDAAGRLRAWTPAPRAAMRPMVTPARRPTERGVHTRKPETYNPRDDWPEPAVDVSGAEFTALDGVYEGTYGCFTDRAIHARNGAVVTLIRCAIDRNGPGAKVMQGSTLVLYECAVRSADLSVEADSALLVLGDADRAADG